MNLNFGFVCYLVAAYDSDSLVFRGVAVCCDDCVAAGVHGCVTANLCERAIILKLFQAILNVSSEHFPRDISFRRILVHFVQCVSQALKNVLDGVEVWTAHGLARNDFDVFGGRTGEGLRRVVQPPVVLQQFQYS